MKAYVLTVDDIYEGVSGGQAPRVYFNNKEASEKLEELYRSGKEIYQNEYDKFEHIRGKSFSMYKDGRHMEGHYDACVTEVEIQGSPKAEFKLNVIFGEQATRKAEETDYARTRRSIKEGRVEGDYKSFSFTTQEDRISAICLLEAANGWDNAYWEKNPKDGE